MQSGADSKSIDSKYYQSKRRRVKITKEIHAATMLGIIVLAFALCWLPLHIINTIIR